MDSCCTSVSLWVNSYGGEGGRGGEGGGGQKRARKSDSEGEGWKRRSERETKRDGGRKK